MGRGAGPGKAGKPPEQGGQQQCLRGGGAFPTHGHLSALDRGLPAADPPGDTSRLWRVRVSCQ